jgi:hypothetical protein
MPRLFALDQNYPEPIVDALAEFLADDAELIPIRRIDERLPTAEDWQVLQALHLHGRDWDGLITSDKNMLGLPKELAVLCQTKLTLVVAVAAGHDPIKATGLLLTHLGSICEQTRADSAQVWTLRTARKAPEDPWIHMTQAAARQDISADTLYRRERLTGDDLAADPLG